MAQSVSPKFLNIARPYALAAFEYAQQENDLPAWLAFLENASRVAQDPLLAKLLSNPQISSSQFAALFKAILESQLNPARQHFLLLVADNQRLLALPAMLQQFNDFYDALKKLSTIRVVTAVDPETSFREKLSQSLSKRLRHEVTLACEIDPSIIGGAIVHIGDRVIDGSVRGKLSRLLESLLR